jgi:hypothetical protein
MRWFGSSAGDTLTNNFLEARSVLSWLKHGWHDALVYHVSFTVMAMVIAWNPTPKVKKTNTRNRKSALLTQIQVAVPQQIYVKFFASKGFNNLLQSNISLATLSSIKNISLYQSRSLHWFCLRFTGMSISIQG